MVQAVPRLYHVAKNKTPMSTTTLPALTLIQPWASWTALGWKTAETRTSMILLKRLQDKRFYIHAGKAWDETACDTAAKWLTPEQIHQTKAEIWFTRGQILCVVEGGKARPMHPEQERDALIGHRYPVAMSEPSTVWRQRYALPVKVVEQIDSRPLVKGQQGIWKFQYPAHGN